LFWANEPVAEHTAPPVGFRQAPVRLGDPFEGTVRGRILCLAAEMGRKVPQFVIMQVRKPVGARYNSLAEQ
jgi:hypothetical protein